MVGNRNQHVYPKADEELATPTFDSKEFIRRKNRINVNSNAMPSNASLGIELSAGLTLNSHAEFSGKVVFPEFSGKVVFKHGNMGQNFMI
ncbi:hypothetical protein SO802_008942 [Lithocarpus litseifolius]|uniref:Uncharacterized protein n=1 Tax=Lithocarpus litseifolius TaxID=425828 RepID=A0AAW2DA04_9ROSI